MTIDNMRCFLILATELNYTKAAEISHTSQASMSRKIYSMEEELGFKLFHRDHHLVELTEAGAAYCSVVKDMLARYDDSVLQIQNMSYHLSSSINIGIGFYEHVLIQTPMQNFLKSHNIGKLNLEYYSYHQLVERLLEDQLDIIVTSDQFLFEYNLEGITSVLVNDQEWNLLVNKDHPLAQADCVSHEMLKTENIVSMYQGSITNVRRLLSVHGIDVESVDYVNSLEAKLLLVDANRGVGFIPSFIDVSAYPNIVKKYITPPYRPRKYYMLYRTSNKNPLLHDFVELLRSTVSNS